MIRGYVITADHEKARAANVQHLLTQLPGLKKTPAIYPEVDHVPFAKQILAAAKHRRGNPFLPGELGVLLSNRRIWMDIRATATTDEHFLIVESDSQVQQLEVLQKEFATLTARYDLFFWGAWLGNMVLKRSARIRVDATHYAGTPFLPSV
ncbi:MAG: hypothetical protein EBR19_07370, partial [Chitinophagaceae bacterium]|nr:hypothetical protein [Chitinophagaceae bacterium]